MKRTVFVFVTTLLFLSTTVFAGPLIQELSPLEVMYDTIDAIRDLISITAYTVADGGGGGSGYSEYLFYEDFEDVSEWIVSAPSGTTAGQDATNGNPSPSYKFQTSTSTMNDPYADVWIDLINGQDDVTITFDVNSYFTYGGCRATCKLRVYDESDNRLSYKNLGGKSSYAYEGYESGTCLGRYSSDWLEDVSFTFNPNGSTRVKLRIIGNDAWVQQWTRCRYDNIRVWQAIETTTTTTTQPLEPIICTATATNPCYYGDYKIYSDLGTAYSWARVIIRDLVGNTVDTMIINQGDIKQSSSTELEIYVMTVRALQDGTVVGTDIIVGPFGTVEPLITTTTTKPQVCLGPEDINCPAGSATIRTSTYTGGHLDGCPYYDCCGDGTCMYTELVSGLCPEDCETVTTTTTTTPVYECTETDDGINFYQRGECWISTYYDYDYGGGGGAAGVADRCLDSHTVQECYCASNELAYMDYYCPYGCADGACIPYQPPECTGYINLNLNPNEAPQGTRIVAAYSGLKDCYTEEVKIARGSCHGENVCDPNVAYACLVGMTTTTSSYDYTYGYTYEYNYEYVYTSPYVSDYEHMTCYCSFQAPEIEGDYLYYACVDKNQDGDYTDPGEQGTAMLRVREQNLHRLDFYDGWNMFSWPVSGENYVTTYISPDCTSYGAAWHYSNGEYVRAEQPMAGQGYWLKFNVEDQSECYVTMYGDDITIDDFPALDAGWNQIGGTSEAVMISDVLGTCEVRSGPWRYDTPTGKYISSDYLEPGGGYWLSVEAACKLRSDDQPPLPPDLS
jgi:hypothetical protein